MAQMGSTTGTTVGANQSLSFLDGLGKVFLGGAQAYIASEFPERFPDSPYRDRRSPEVDREMGGQFEYRRSGELWKQAALIGGGILGVVLLVKLVR